MPFFTSSTEFQINDGNFYDVAGDMNIHAVQSMNVEGSNPLATLESGLNASTGRLVGAQRNGRQSGASRIMPYDLARRPPLSGFSELDELSASSSVSLSSSPLPPQHPSNNSPTPRVLGPSSGHVSDWRGPMEPARGAEYWNHEQDRAGPWPYEDRNASTSNVVGPSFPAREHRTHIHIGGNVNQIQHHGERGFHILHRAAAGDAFHDSAERCPQPKCHPETRKKMLEDLWDWSSKTDSNSTVLWLHGPAGAGKSAIAQSFCQKLETQNCLGASFFFKRGNPSSGTGKKLFPTLAYQLARSLPEMKTAVSRVVEDDPSITDRALPTQLQRLIIDPCRQTTCSRTLVIVIDGLDECDGKEIQREILRSIGTSIRGGPLPLRFFIASRPEPHIRESFTSALLGIHFGVNINQSFDDVRTYLLGEFTRIHREHHETMATIPVPWPAPEDVDHLVWRSSGYFIYASTVIKFIDDRDFRPTDRLKLIRGSKKSDDESPFAALDQLYMQILSQIPARTRLLRFLTAAAGSLRLSLDHIEQLLEMEPGDVQLTLRGLQSVMGVKYITRANRSDCEDWSYQQVILHHASFWDFLHDPQRAGIFYIVSAPRVTHLASCILKAFSFRTYTKTNNYVGWFLDLSWALQYLVFSEPTEELISLLRSFDPIRLFHPPYSSGRVIRITFIADWLKKSQPPPEDLIQVWQDYDFMRSFESTAWSSCTSNKPMELSQEDWDRSQEIFSQASPSLIRLLQAVISIHKCELEGTLLKIHLMLDISWNELRTAICSLRSFADDKRFLTALFIVAEQSVMITACFDSIMSDLTCGALRVMQRVFCDELPLTMMRNIQGWSRYLRHCQPSQQLVQDVCQIPFFPHLVEDYENIVQWLKTSPDPPLELISNFEHSHQEAHRLWVKRGEEADMIETGSKME